MARHLSPKGRSIQICLRPPSQGPLILTFRPLLSRGRLILICRLHRNLESRFIGLGSDPEQGESLFYFILLPSSIRFSDISLSVCFLLLPRYCYHSLIVANL